MICLASFSLISLAENACESLRQKTKTIFIANRIYGADLKITNVDDIHVGDRIFGKCGDRQYVIVYKYGRGKDSIMDLGEGDSIRFVGKGESFDCEDPDYANIDKTKVSTIMFPEGESVNLCMAKESLRNQKTRKSYPEGVISGSTVSDPKMDTNNFVDCNDPAYSGRTLSSIHETHPINKCIIK